MARLTWANAADLAPRFWLHGEPAPLDPSAVCSCCGQTESIQNVSNDDKRRPCPTLWAITLLSFDWRVVAGEQVNFYAESQQPEVRPRALAGRVGCRRRGASR